MIIYLVALALVIAGASTGFFTLLQGRVRDQRMGLYDAKGYWVVSMLMLTFLVTSLAYFWGVTRFALINSDVGLEPETVIGMLITVFGCIAAMGAGWLRFAKAGTNVETAYPDGR
jgi:hypothetical protein